MLAQVKQYFGTEIQHCINNLIVDPSKYKMDESILIILKCMG